LIARKNINIFDLPMEKVPVQYLSYNEAEGQRASFFILGENSSVDILVPPKYKP
jgi:hypothetical protein